MSSSKMESGGEQCRVELDRKLQSEYDDEMFLDEILLNSPIADPEPIPTIDPNGATMPQSVGHGENYIGDSTVEPSTDSEESQAVKSPNAHVASLPMLLPPPPPSPSNVAFDQSSKRGRGWPRGSLNRSKDLGRKKDEFTSYVITVNVGQDLSAVIIEHCLRGKRNVSILCANGHLAVATLCLPATGLVTYEGRYKILQLSGNFLVTENDGDLKTKGGINITLSGLNGNVFGGAVGGVLIAATSVEVVLMSFNSNSNSHVKEMENVPQET